MGCTFLCSYPSVFYLRINDLMDYPSGSIKSMTGKAYFISGFRPTHPQFMFVNEDSVMKPKMVLRKSSYHVNSLIKQVDDSNFVPFFLLLADLNLCLRDPCQVVSTGVISSWSSCSLSLSAVDHVLLERWQYTSAFLQPPPASSTHKGDVSR